MDPDQVVISEIPDYLRGREAGEVSAIMQRACLANGLAAEQIHIASTPLAGAQFALERMQVNDLGLFLVLSERDQVVDQLQSLSRQ